MRIPSNHCPRILGRYSIDDAEKAVALAKGVTDDATLQIVVKLNGCASHKQRQVLSAAGVEKACPKRPPRARRSRGGKCGAEPIADILEREERVIALWGLHDDALDWYCHIDENSAD